MWMNRDLKWKKFKIETRFYFLLFPFNQRLNFKGTCFLNELQTNKA